MPPHVYHQVKAACYAVLRSMFLCAATPIEGPEQKDYGDLDIHVTMETGLVFPTSPQPGVPRALEELAADIKTASNAEHVVVNPHTSSVHLAIPWPKDDSQLGEEREATERFVQVDIHICKDLDQMFWVLFKSAHGDAWTLLGSIIRPFGLTVDDEELWLRIPEIEKLDRKKCRVLLTTDPVEVLHFLGMQVEGYWSEPFATIGDMFTYIATCRFFTVQELSLESPQDNTSDKRNMRTRPIFRKWFEDFLPGLRAHGHFKLQRQGVFDPSDLRVRVRDEVFQTFSVESIYWAQLKDWRLKKEPEIVKNLIRSAIPDDLDPQFRGSLLSAIKKIVMEDATEFGGPRPKMSLRDDEGFYDKDMTRAFVEENWEGIGRLAFKKYSDTYYAELQSQKLKKFHGTAIQSQ